MVLWDETLNFKSCLFWNGDIKPIYCLIKFLIMKDNVSDNFKTCCLGLENCSFLDIEKSTMFLRSSATDCY